jgi:hypothetical protein
MPRTVLTAALLLLPSLAAQAQMTLPVVEEVEWGSFRAHCKKLLTVLEKTGSNVPARTVREVRALLDRKPDDPASVCRAVQQLLDPFCLLAVNINAESRVKAARGSAEAQLQRDQPTVVLVKIHNEGGVTHALRLDGRELARADERKEGRWLKATLLTDAPFVPELSGERLEYRLLRLTPAESGKREATFQFDVGQGTQDLGFRAEVPILFAIREPKRK